MFKAFALEGEADYSRSAATNHEIRRGADTMGEAEHQVALEELRSLLAYCRAKSDAFNEMIGQRDKVLAAYGPVFTLEHAKELKAEEFKAFLLFENNKHWTGLHRQGGIICSNMRALRKGMASLLDESKDLATRLNEAVDGVRGMGKGIVTAILFVANPHNYGVWNNKSELAMNQLGIWPGFNRGTSFGEKYAGMNEVLLRLAGDLEVDLWTLDSLWDFYLAPPEGYTTEAAEAMVAQDEANRQRFGLERHLHEFLRDNWDNTELGKTWKLYEEQGEPEAGYEYPCSVGKIDLLARSRGKGNRWLVVELKRDQTSDTTVGQVCRYMGWVKENLAEKGHTVEGLIIGHEADEKLYYALKTVPDVRVMLYEVEFHLRSPENPPRK